jgi:hypothetical protein
MDTGLGGLHSQSGRYGELKNLDPVGNQTSVVQPVARRYTDSTVILICRKLTLKVELSIFCVLTIHRFGVLTNNTHTPLLLCKALSDSRTLSNYFSKFRQLNISGNERVNSLLRPALKVKGTTMHERCWIPAQ